MRDESNIRHVFMPLFRRPSRILAEAAGPGIQSLALVGTGDMD